MSSALRTASQRTVWREVCARGLRTSGSIQEIRERRTRSEDRLGSPSTMMGAYNSTGHLKLGALFAPLTPHGGHHRTHQSNARDHAALNLASIKTVALALRQRHPPVLLAQGTKGPCGILCRYPSPDMRDDPASSLALLRRCHRSWADETLK